MADNEGDNSSNDQNSNGSNDESAQTPPANQDTTDWKAELDKWKADSRKHERNSRTLAKELDDLKKASMTDQQKAIAEAVDEAKKGWNTEMGSNLALTEFKAKAETMLGKDKVTALLPTLKVDAFLNDDGQPDSDAIDNFLETIAPPKQTNTFDFGQGARGNGQGNAQSLADDPFAKEIFKLSGFDV